MVLRLFQTLEMAQILGMHQFPPDEINCEAVRVLGSGALLTTAAQSGCLSPAAGFAGLARGLGGRGELSTPGPRRCGVRGVGRTNASSRAAEATRARREGSTVPPVTWHR